MFETTELNPPDKIFGLNEEFKGDSNSSKINLTVGMYQNELGETPVLRCVQQVEKKLVETGESHTYLPIDGLPQYNRNIAELILGIDHKVIEHSRATSAQTPGGTGALRVTGELLKREYKANRIWISQPTWANHLNVFSAAGLEIQQYSYLDGAGTSFDFDACLGSIQEIPAGEPILLHTVCHNPTGADPTPEQWSQVIEVLIARNLLPIFDFAYQGFGSGVDEDAFPIRTFARHHSEAIICNSFSKNFNLYGERVGGITVIAKEPQHATAVMSQIKKIIRTIYSNPPMHGGKIVANVLADQELKSLWLSELEEMRVRIVELRKLFVDNLKAKAEQLNFGHMISQRGMFSFTGLANEVADQLKRDHSIYLLRSGRMNVAGINANNVDRLTDAIADVLS